MQVCVHVCGWVVELFHVISCGKKNEKRKEAVTSCAAWAFTQLHKDVCLLSLASLGYSYHQEMTMWFHFHSGFFSNLLLLWLMWNVSDFIDVGPVLFYWWLTCSVLGLAATTSLASGFPCQHMEGLRGWFMWEVEKPGKNPISQAFILLPIFVYNKWTS